MRYRRAGWWTLALLVLLSAAVPATHLLQPRIQRARRLADLDSPDAARRRQALDDVARYAPHDEALGRAVIQGLAACDDPAFTERVAALDVAALWRRESVGDAAWLRWLDLLARSPDAGARQAAAERLARLADVADDARPAAILAALVRDADPAVRAEALTTLIELAGAASDGTTYLPLLGAMARDDQEAIARRAWIALGLMKRAAEFDADPPEARPAVAMARLWAGVWSNPAAAQPAIAALADPLTRDASAYALAFSGAPEARAALLGILQTPVAAVDDTNQRLVWRAVLASPRPVMARRDYTMLEEAVSAWMMDEGPDPRVDPIALAATYQAGIEGAMRQSDDPYYFEKAMLATVEGQRPPWMHWPLENHRKSALLRVRTIAVSASPQAEFLADVFAAEESALRDLACVVAADRLTREQLDPVVRGLIVDVDDRAKMSGAILAGLTGLHTDLLAEREAVEDVFAVRVVQRLGLWMAGRRALDAGALLMREDLPRSTILLAMLHRREYSAMDQALGLYDEQVDATLDLLVRQRWWYVLQPHLPPPEPPPPEVSPQDACGLAVPAVAPRVSPDVARRIVVQAPPRLWLWADPSLQAFQVEVWRCWRLLERHERPGADHGQTRGD